MMKKYLSLLLVIILSFSLIGFADVFAGTTSPVTIFLRIGDSNMTVNGNTVAIDPGRDTAPVISEGRTLLPARAIAEAMGASVLWDEALRTVTISSHTTDVVFTLDLCIAYVNGESKILDVAPTVINGRTMIPLRAFAEFLGYNIEWDGTTQTITVSSQANAAHSQTINSQLKVHFIDVGQGDSIFIELPNGETALIDAGPSEYTTSSYVSSLGYSSITYVIATHPDADHITGMPAVLSAFGVNKFYMPQKSHTTEIFKKMMSALGANGCDTAYAYGGLNIVSDNGLSMDVFAPNVITSDNNNCSVVVKLTYLNTSFLFTGDAEAESEQSMIYGGYNLDSDVIKIGHHGSKSSSTYAFLEKVTPYIAVISVGAGNSYGHPSAELVSMLQNMGVTLFTTEMLGTVVLTSDGNSIYGNKTALPQSYVPSGFKNSNSTSGTGNSGSSYTKPSNNFGGVQQPSTNNNSQIVYKTKTGSKYHKDGCSYLKSKIQTTVSEAKASGLTPCSRCNPPS